MNCRVLFCFTFALLLASASPLAPAQSHAGHGDGKNAAPPASVSPGAASSPSTQAFERANDRMHKDMGVAFTGNADVDFMRAMIPHHQGAIDMAQVVLKYGKDPKVKALARDVISAQEKEIATMRKWLADRGY